MSDPLSSHEIEDVLSSIRRLVSEDFRPGAVRPQVSPEEDVGRAEARLILTPALRVIQKAAAEAAARPSGQMVEEIDWDFEALVPEDSISPSPAPAPLAEDLRNDRLRAAATMAFPRASAPPVDLFRSRRSERELAEEEEDELQGAAGLVAGTPLRVGSDAPEVMIWDDDAFDEAALQARRHDLLLDADEEGETLATAQTPAPLEPHQTSLPLSGALIEPEATAPMWSDMNDRDGAWSESPPAWEEPAWEEPAEAEPVRFLRAEMKENPLARAWANRLEETMQAELAAEFQEPLEAEAVAVAEGGKADDPPAAEASASDTDRPEGAEAARDKIEAEVAQELGQIDEDLLRELVREVLREELAGALGERITRNVRKLVRMEINRALASGDFQ